MNLFEANHHSLPRWASFENPHALPGEGAKSNGGAKSELPRLAEEAVRIHKM